MTRATPRTARLHHRLPFDWDGLRSYLGKRAIPGVEFVADDGRYGRTIRIEDASGWLAVGPGPDAHRETSSFRLMVSADIEPYRDRLVPRVRRLLDLDADPEAVADDLGRDPVLAPLVARRPGLRVAGAVDGFEVAVRAVLGQQVTVRGASTLSGRLIRRFAESLRERPEGLRLTHLPITADRLADADPAALAGIGLPRARAATLVALARAFAGGELPELTSDDPAGDPSDLVERLVALPGIGPWTATYVAMRALPWRDAFPASDLGLRKAMGGMTPARLRETAEAWRPWRAYAAQHLWASLADEPS